MRINLYGCITWYTPEMIESKLHEAIENGHDEIDLYINSEGGDVLAGLKIISLLKSKDVKVNVYIEFLAASMAADIAMSFDKVCMNKYGLLMFHDAFTSSQELSESQKMYLEKQSMVLREMVVEKRKLDPEKFAELCKREFWFTADEALEFGLIDEIYVDEMIEEVEYDEMIVSKSFELAGDIYKKINLDAVKEAEVIVETVEEVLPVVDEVIEVPVDEVVEEVLPVIDAKEELIKALEAKLAETEKELTAFKVKEETEAKKAFELKINTVLEAAVKDGKIVDKTEWFTLLSTNFDSTKTIIDKLPSNKKSINLIDNLIVNKVNNDRTEWTLSDWEKNDSKGLLELLKNNKSMYSDLFKKQYGVEFKG